MNYYLILSDDLLLVSDEKAEKSFGISKNDYTHIHDFRNTVDADCIDFYKLIAGTPSLPKITFSEEVYKEMKEGFGWVDVEREARTNKEIVNHSKSSFIPAFIEGFKLCQSLNKNRFSEEDMYMLAAKVVNDIAKNRMNSEWNMKTTPKIIADEFIEQQHQPKRVKVEVEMEKVCNYPKCGCDLGVCGSADLRNMVDGVKISNNTIKITRLCK